MAFGDGHSLWFDGEQRFYLLPDGEPLPEGDLALTSLLGRRQRVDHAAVADHRITREEAIRRMRGRASGLFDLMRGVVSEALRAPVSSGAKPRDFVPERPVPPAVGQAVGQVVGHAVEQAVGAVQSVDVERLLREAAAKLEALADRMKRPGDDEPTE